MLVDRLPPESSTNTKVREQFTDEQLAEMAKQHTGGYGPWGRLDYWLAGLSDRVDNLTYTLIRVHGSRLDPPTPYPRPGLVALRGDVTDPPDPELVALLEQRRAERRAQLEQPPAGT